MLFYVHDKKYFDISGTKRFIESGQALIILLKTTVDMLTEILQLLLSCSRYTKGVFLPPKAIQFRGFHIAWKGTDERENANILPCCLPTCPNDWFSPLQLRKKKRIIHSLHNILEVRQECQFRILKELLRYTGWGQCIGTANRGYCKAGVTDTWKWY